MHAAGPFRRIGIHIAASRCYERVGDLSALGLRAFALRRRTQN